MKGSIRTLLEVGSIALLPYASASGAIAPIEGPVGEEAG
jgi:hypothetical protein